MRKVLYLLGGLSDGDVDWLIAHGSRERVGAGTALIREREPISAVYIVLDGALEVSATGLGGTPIRLGSGDVVGEMSFVESRLPSASVTAVEASTVLAIPRSQLGAKLETDAEFAARFYRALSMFLAHRLRSTMRRFGYGQDRKLDEEADDEDELDSQVLDSIHMAGYRFDHVLRRLLAE